MTLTLREAYNKGRASWSTGSDWDDAVTRFANKYEPGEGFGPLQHAWADGWSDQSESREKWHAFNCQDTTCGHHVWTESE